MNWRERELHGANRNQSGWRGKWEWEVGALLLVLDTNSAVGVTLIAPNTVRRHHTTALHYGLTGGWVQKFKCSYLLCFLHSALVFKARGQCGHHAFTLA